MALAHACVDAGIRAEVVSGGMPVPQLPEPAVRVHQLESVRSADLYFSAIVDFQGEPVTQQLQQRRSKQLLDIFHDLNPKVLVTELQKLKEPVSFAQCAIASNAAQATARRKPFSFYVIIIKVY